MDAPKLHRVAGSGGPPIVLLHGFGADRLSWLANVQDLGTVGRVYSLDLPGHGASALAADPGLRGIARAVDNAIVEAKLGAVHLVGHSLGGAIAIMLAASHPDRTLGLALLAAAGLGRSIDADFLNRYPRLVSPEEAEELLQRLVSRPRLINRSMISRVLEQLNAPSARAGLTAVASAMRDVESDLTGPIDVVTGSGIRRLVIWGGADPIIPVDIDKISRFGGEHVLLPGIAHLPHIEAIRTVNSRLVSFITETTSGAN